MSRAEVFNIFDSLKRVGRNRFLDGFAQAEVRRLAMRFDESVGTAQRVLRDAHRVAAGPLEASGARALAAVMQLSGASASPRCCGALHRWEPWPRHLPNHRPTSRAGCIRRWGGPTHGLLESRRKHCRCLRRSSSTTDDAGFEDLHGMPLVSALVEMDAAVRPLSMNLSAVLSGWLERMRKTRGCTTACTHSH